MLKRSMKVAVMRVKDRMRDGASLMIMNTVHGKRWFVVPGREVDPEVAQKVIAEADVYPSNDALFPGITQTFHLGRPNDDSNA